MIVIACPGQGSQTPGFLSSWLDEKHFRDHLDAMADALELDILGHGTTADAETIRDTAVAQPLVVAAGLLALRPLLQKNNTNLAGIAGHSVGEITAAVGAGILTEEDALSFVKARGVAMADAARQTPSGMSAVIGADETELAALLEELGLEAANFNGGGQIVVAGDLGALARLKEEPPACARVIPLRVAGAFHTRYMKPAVPTLESLANRITPKDPNRAIWTNRDGTLVDSGARFLDMLVAQVSHPVRWDKCMDSFSAANITGIIELPPAGTLVGLAKRVLPDVPFVSIRTPDDLDAAKDLLRT